MAKKWEEPKLLFFTPDRKRITADSGITGQDAAWYIFSGYLFRASKVFVNGEEQPLDSPIPDGATVRIVTSDVEDFNPRRLSWITSPSAFKEAKKRIRLFLRSNQVDPDQLNQIRNELIVIGGETFIGALGESRRNKRIPYIPRDRVIGEIVQKFGITQNWEDFFIKVGLSDYSPTELNNKIEMVVSAIEQFLTENLISIHIKKDRKGIIKDITTILTDAGINIDDLFNQGSEETGNYTYYFLSLDITRHQKEIVSRKLSQVPDIDVILAGK